MRAIASFALRIVATGNTTAAAVVACMAFGPVAAAFALALSKPFASTCTAASSTSTFSTTLTTIAALATAT